MALDHYNSGMKKRRRQDEGDPLEQCDEDMVVRIDWYEGRISLQDLLLCLHPPAEPSTSNECFNTPLDPSVQTRLKATKERIDTIMDKSVFYRLRGELNQYEGLGKGPRGPNESPVFVNRSAMKMCNLDHAFDFLPNYSAFPFSFVDLCAGPGGFSEYLLLRARQRSQCAVVGFAISKHMPDEGDSCNWNIDYLHSPPDIAILNIPSSQIATNGHDQITMSSVSDRVLYIDDGVDDTGDLLHVCNVNNFAQEVRSRFEQGVNLVMADGGFDFTGNREDRELANAPLLIAQMITALKVLKDGGVFFVKVFELYEEFSFDLFVLFGALFEDVCLSKPITSRVISSEKYLVCKRLKENVEASTKERIIEELYKLSDRCMNHLMNKSVNTSASAVPFLFWKGSMKFQHAHDYLRRMNTMVAMKCLESCEQLCECYNHYYDEEAEENMPLNRDCETEVYVSKEERKSIVKHFYQKWDLYNLATTVTVT